MDLLQEYSLGRLERWALIHLLQPEEGTDESGTHYCSMRELGAVVLYLGVIAGIVGLAAIGAIWLVTPDQELASAPRPPTPIPPRIAESIERKASALRPPEPEVYVMRPVMRPAMQDVPVSLPSPAIKPTRERTAVKPRRKTPTGRPLIVEIPAGYSPPVSSRPITTTRNDSPF